MDILGAQPRKEGGAAALVPDSSEADLEGAAALTTMQIWAEGWEDASVIRLAADPQEEGAAAGRPPKVDEAVDTDGLAEGL